MNTGKTKARERAAFAKNIKTLAPLLGVSRQTVHKWLAQYGRDCPQPGPEGHSVSAWREFMAENALGKNYAISEPNTDTPKARPAEPSPVQGEKKPTLADAKIECEMARAEKLKRQNWEAEQKLMHADELALSLGTFFGSLASAFQRLPASAAPYLLNASNVYEVIQILEDEMNGLLTAVQKFEWDEPARLAAALTIATPAGMTREAFEALAAQIIADVHSSMGARFLGRAKATPPPQIPAAPPEEIAEENPTPRPPAPRKKTKARAR